MFLSKIKYTGLVIIGILSWGFFQISSASAVDYQLGGLNSSAGQAGYNTAKTSNDIPIIVGNYINGVLALLGVAFIALVMWGAFDIIGAGGDAELVKKSKGRIKNGAIGILIILLSFFLAKAFVGFVASGVFNLNN